MKSRFMRITGVMCAAAVCAGIFSSCASNGSNGNSSGNTPAADNSSASDAADTSAPAPVSEPVKMNAVFGDIRTEFNENLDLSDYPLTPSEVPDGYSLTIEAESGELLGSAKVNDLPEASGGAYVSGVNLEGDELKLTAEIEYSGFYDMCFMTKAGGHKENNVLLDGMKIGDISTDSNGEFGESPLYNIYLDKGRHEISLTPNWGYFDVDCLKITAAADPITADDYKVEAKLTNPNADENTKRLFNFLCDIYGKYSLAGQYAEKGRESFEYKRISKDMGKSFSVLGLDVSGYSLGSQAHGTTSRTIEYAYDWYTNAGGIVQLCWHWTSPEPYAPNGQANPWYSSFYKEASTLNLDEIMNGKDDTGYQLLMDDIDNMAGELARLRDAGVPVLWRPLHEASGGWFWWGNCEAESYKKLWNVMYDKMTNEHNLTNLIWVWNGQNPDWYPGDETVDIHGWDIYAGNRVDTSQSGRFADMARNYGSKTKLIALTENGCVMDPDKVMRDNARWLFWGTWSDPFTMKKGVILNDEYTTLELLNKAYNHERVLTLDELPDLKSYRLG